VKKNVGYIFHRLVAYGVQQKKGGNWLSLKTSGKYLGANFLENQGKCHFLRQRKWLVFRGKLKLMEINVATAVFQA